MSPSESERRSAAQRSAGSHPRSRRPASQPATQPATKQSGASGQRKADPSVPDDVSWYDLDAGARRELQSLPKELAERVGGHLAAAGLALDDDADLAHSHAGVARRLASRVALTREALGLTAYAVGNYAQALAELRAYRRLSGDESHLALVADCERALGRPEQAMELAQSAAARRLDPVAARELRLVVAGARLDMGQPEAARVLLEQDRSLKSNDVDDSVVRLRYAYADALLASGRADDARRWMAMVAEQDVGELTDAKQRVTTWEQSTTHDGA